MNSEAPKMEFEPGDLLTVFDRRPGHGSHGGLGKARVEIAKWLIIEKKLNYRGMIYYESVIMWARRGYWSDTEIPGSKFTLTEVYLEKDCSKIEVQRGQIEK